MNHLVTKCSHADINGSIQLSLKNIFLKLELLLGGSQKVNPETNLRAIFPYYISTYKAQSIFCFRSHLLYEYYTRSLIVPFIAFNDSWSESSRITCKCTCKIGFKYRRVVN